MVLQQVDLRATAAPAPLAHSSIKGEATAAGGLAGKREPRRYVEGESEQEAEAMDVELEEGSDVGSIEDIELGAESGSEADADVDADMDEDEDEEEGYEEGLDDDDDDDGEDSEEDSEGDEGPWLNGFVDDEAEEAEDESESE